MVGSMVLEQSSGFPKLIDIRQGVDKVMAVLAKANQPLKVREPSPWDRTRCAVAILGLVGRMVSLEWAIHPAAPFALTDRFTKNGFRRLPPNLRFEKAVVLLVHIDIYAARPEIGSVKMKSGGPVALGGIFVLVAVFPCF